MNKKFKTITTIIVFVILIGICTAKFIFAASQYNVSNLTELKNAINNASNGDTIMIKDTITLTETLTVDKFLRFEGSSNCTLKLNTNDDSRHIAASRGLHIENLTFDGSSNCGGIAVRDGLVTINNSKFVNINVYRKGGALSIYPGCNTTISNSTFERNYAYEGGAISTNSNLSIINCKFNNNYAYNDDVPNEDEPQGQATNITGGGAICVTNNAYLEVKKSIFTNNKSRVFGGAIYSNGSVDVTESQFEYNSLQSNVTDTINGNAIYVARSNGTFNINKCQFTGNYAPSEGAVISFIPLKVSNSGFDRNSGKNGSAVTVAVTTGEFTNCSFTNNVGPSIMAYDNPIDYPNYNTKPKATVTNCTFWGNSAPDPIETNITTRYFYTEYEDGSQTPHRFENDEIVVNLKGCIIANEAQSEQDNYIYVSNCAGYYDGPVEDIFMSSSPQVLKYDTQTKIGPVNENTTLKITYLPIKPFGRADDKIDNSISWTQPKDQNDIERGQAYNDGRTYIDVGAIEELGNIYDKKVSGDNQVAIVNTNFQDPLIVKAYYESRTQQIEVVPLKDFLFISVTPNPATNGASATLSPSTTNVNTDSGGNAQVTAKANDKPGQYTVTFVPDDNYKGRVILPVSIDPKDESKNYFSNIEFTLTNIAKMVHVRQVVINSVSGLEIPHSGYIVLSTEDLSNVNNITVDSGKHEFGVNYTSFLMNSKPNSVYSMVPIIPEYYEYAGYTQTDTNVEHTLANITAPPAYPSVDFNSDTSGEYWVTIYITPKNPDAYSWSDAVNDFYQQR